MVGVLSRLTDNETGVIIAATALLFPTSVVLYGGSVMILAAYNTYRGWVEAREDKRAAEAKAREEALAVEAKAEGRKEIVALLEEHNIEIPPEVLRKLNGDAEPN